METNYKETAKQIAEAIGLKCPSANHVRLSGFGSGLCPYMGWVTIDALSPAQWPYQIAENSIFLTFCIDFKTNKMELRNCGHIYLSEADKKSEKYKYYAMRGMVDIAEQGGVKKFRKCNYKSVEETAIKLSDYFEKVMQQVRLYTHNEFPYKNEKRYGKNL